MVEKYNGVIAVISLVGDRESRLRTAIKALHRAFGADHVWSELEGLFYIDKDGGALNVAQVLSKAVEATSADQIITFNVSDVDGVALNKIKDKSLHGLANVRVDPSLLNMA